MKELSIEQKARAYDESLERAKKLQKTCDSQAVVGWCEYIFPVLKESEDEKIRKEMIFYLKEEIPQCSIQEHADKMKEFVAWLEKQDQSKQVSIWKHWKDGIAGNGEGKPIYLVKIGNTYSLNSCLGFECDYIELSELDNLMLEKQGYTDGIIEKAKTEKQRVIITETDGNANIDWDTRSLEDARKLLECGLQYINTELEKQSKQKETLCDKCKKEHPSHSCQDITELGRCAVEHEQKSANKVEPIFRVGDYIRNKKTGDKCLIEQLDMAAKAYCYVNYDGAAINHSDFPFVKQDEWELLVYKVAEQKLAEDSAKVSESSIEEKDMTEYKKGFECGKQRVLKYPEDFGLCKKSDGKVEPKFHEGDWIINPRTGLIKHIKNVLLCGINGNYEFESSSMPIDFVDNYFHLWSIEDAKDGDVLVVGDEDGTATAICGKNDKLGNNILYCYYDDENGFAINTPIALACLLHPAAKEQRDRLFQKMKESGYEWDAEKKELKKIVVPIFHIGDRVRYKGHACDGVITEITDADYICGDAKLPISTQDKLELVGQKPAECIKFNNEFENHVSNLIASVLNREHEYNEGFVKYVAQSLLGYAKNELKPTEWSEEDEDMIQALGACIDATIKGGMNYISFDSKSILIGKVKNWLKFLRHQNNITDKELAQARKEAYNEALDKIEYHDDWPTFDDGWNAAIWYLKKRNDRPQSHWKPSDTQIQSLKEACDKSWEPDGLDPLYTLYEQLKKLKGE